MQQKYVKEKKKKTEKNWIQNWTKYERLKNYEVYIKNWIVYYSVQWWNEVRFLCQTIYNIS